MYPTALVLFCNFVTCFLHVASGRFVTGQYDILGCTRDDAIGECYDKVFRAVGLPSSDNESMGAALERIAHRCPPYLTVFVILSSIELMNRVRMHVYSLTFIWCCIAVAIPVRTTFPSE